MKKILFFGLMALITALAVNSAAAQVTYGNSTFPLDTLAGTDNATYTLPLKYDTDAMTYQAVWQVRLTRLAADTATISIYLEESVDDATSSPDYVVRATIANAVVVGPSNTEQYYFFPAPIYGKKQRLRVTHAGSNSTTIIEVDSLVRKKQAILITDEY